jgi:HlyD family secretion protein
MHILSAVRPREAALRLGLIAPMVLLSACQVVSARSTPPPPRLLPESSVSVAGVAVGGNSANLPMAKYTVKRDTLRETLQLDGKVVPGRSAKLRFRGAGNVTAVYVSAGQSVSAGDVLAELSLDDESLRSARAQATLAELAYQSEQGKLEELQSGVTGGSAQQLRVTIQRDLAEIEKLENDKSAAQTANQAAEVARESAQETADRRVQRAEATLETANQTLEAAQADVKRAEGDVQEARNQASDEAAAAADAASGPVRAASRQLEQANIRLAQVKLERNTTSAAQQLDMHALQVEQVKEALKDARAQVTSLTEATPSADYTARQIAAETANARGAVRQLARSLETDQLQLKHLQANFEDAKKTDAGEIRVAEVAVEAAKEQLANAQLAEQRAKKRADALAKQASTNTGGATTPSMTAARTAVREAEAAVRAATVNLEDAEYAQASAGKGQQLAARFVEGSLAAARAQLQADQARLAVLQGGNEANQIAQQETRVELLRDQALTAAAAAQPVVAIKAPFDATVAEVSIAAGQTLAPGGQAIEGEGTDGRAAAIRLVSSGATSITADASEAAVSQLSPGRQVDLTFPGLPGQKVLGTIAEIGSTATVSDNKISYPVRIEMGAPPAQLRFGMTAQASLAVSEATDVLVAPRRAIRTSEGRTVVDKILPNGQVQDVGVTVGRTYGSDVEVIAGVHEGDVLAVYEGGLSATVNNPDR